MDERHNLRHSVITAAFGGAGGRRLPTALAFRFLIGGTSSARLQMKLEDRGQGQRSFACAPPAAPMTDQQAARGASPRKKVFVSSCQFLLWAVVRKMRAQAETCAPNEMFPHASQFAQGNPTARCLS